MRWRIAIELTRRLSSPERAVVLCVDENERREAPNQEQALGRTQPLLLMMNAARALHSTGQAEWRTHDDKRDGTALFAASDVKAAERRAIAVFSIIGQGMPRHRVREFRKFLDKVERNMPAGIDIRIMDTATTKLFFGP